MDIQEILKQLDTLFAERRIGEIEDYLQGCLQRAMEIGDFHSAITLTNELIGFYRDTSQYDKSVFYCEQVLAFMKKLNLEGSVPYATTLLNVANAYRAAGKLQESFETYQEVFVIYNQTLGRTDFRYASLYNNLSLLYQEMGDFEKSCECLENALQIVSLYEEAKIELAVTYTNLAMSQLRCERYKSAIQNLQLALTIFEQDEDKDYHYSAALSAAGEAMYQVAEYDKAASYYEKALLEIEKNVGRTRAYEITKENLAQVYAKQKEADERAMENTAISGLELSRRFYEEYGKPMIEEKFPAWKEKIAVGLVGEGSECFGFDDEYSKDHDFGPGFCMWLSDETYEQIGKQLQQAYEELPTTYLGIQRLVTPQGKNRVGVFRIGEFYEKLIGIDHAPQTREEWIVIPEERLATAVNGFVFADEEGVFSTIRNQIKRYYPEELRIKKIAQEAALMAQSGQYNYRRMLLREDYVAAQIALTEYMQHAMKMVYLLNKHFAPFYKWMHRGMQKLLNVKEVSEYVTRLAVVDDYKEKIEIIEEIAAVILEELKKQGLTKGEDTYMDAHTEQILNASLDQMELVNRLVQLEWNAFDKVKNEGGRADCQNDFSTFEVMRKSQYLAWNKDMLLSYIQDFEEANKRDWNLITEKYAWMMESTSPMQFEALKDSLPKLEEEKKAIIEGIVAIQVGWMEEFAKNYPKMAEQARSIHTYEDTEYNTSYETYLRGEMRTYSEQTLYLYGQFIVELAQKGENLAKKIMSNTAMLYGYDSLEEAERKL